MEPKDYNHIKLSQEDKGILACCKSLLYNKNTELYHKMRMAIDAEKVMSYRIPMPADVYEAYKNGAAIMYHLMTNPEFLKECENIYKQ
jgi:hypothetical protein